MKKLSSIRTNLPHLVTQVEENELKNRLYDLGIYPSQTLQLIRRAPLGDPIVVDVEGQLVMLRQSEAELITIQEK